MVARPVPATAIRIPRDAVSGASADICFPCTRPFSDMQRSLPSRRRWVALTRLNDMGESPNNILTQGLLEVRHGSPIHIVLTKPLDRSPNIFVRGAPRGA